MKPATEKILRSGIIDKGFAKMLEKWGYLPEGASELTKNEELKNATYTQLQEFAREIAEEVENGHVLKETSFDLSNLQFPVVIDVLPKTTNGRPGPDMYGVFQIMGMEDRMGRLYFKPQEISKSWFVPGFIISRQTIRDGKRVTRYFEILDVHPLFVGDDEIALQVTVDPISKGTESDLEALLGLISHKSQKLP